MQTQSNSAHMHTSGYFNMEALQATKVLAHYEHMVEKHVLPSSNTTTRLIAQEEVVQCYTPIEALKTNGNANRKHNKEGRIRTLLAITCTPRPYPMGIVNSTTQDILHPCRMGLL